MKHCHKCRIEHHLRIFQVKQVGLAGLALFVAHLLFHVVELFVLPALFVGVGGHLAEHDVEAADYEPTATAIEYHDIIRSNSTDTASSTNLAHLPQFPAATSASGVPNTTPSASPLCPSSPILNPLEPLCVSTSTAPSS